MDQQEEPKLSDKEITRMQLEFDLIVYGYTDQKIEDPRASHMVQPEEESKQMSHHAGAAAQDSVAQEEKLLAEALAKLK